MLEAFIDAPQRNRELSVFPVTAANGPRHSFLLLEEALDSGAVEVRRKGDEANPVFMARNHSLHAVFVLEGESVFQGDSPAVASRSLLLPGKSVTTVPVHSPPKEEGAPEDGGPDVDAWLEAFPLLENQVGSLVLLERRVLGLEAMGSPHLYRPHHHCFLSRFIREAIAEEEAGGVSRIDWSANIQRNEAASVLKALEDAERLPAASAGAGEYWVLDGPVLGGELIFDMQLVHVSVRPTVADANPAHY